VRRALLYMYGALNDDPHFILTARPVRLLLFLRGTYQAISTGIRPYALQLLVVF
jgi:hypothetical protein